jgi:hypothetical protein
MGRSRLAQMIRSGLKERSVKITVGFDKEPTKEGNEMETYRKTISLLAVLALVAFAYASSQVNPSLNVMMALTHGLAMYAIFLNKERK